jgi:hypothetical protein
MYAPTAAADRTRTAGAGECEDQRDEPGRGHHFADQMPRGEPVFCGHLKHAPVEHQIGQERPATPPTH